jgi:hypothetical protein
MTSALVAVSPSLGKTRSRLCRWAVPVAPLTVTTGDPGRVTVRWYARPVCRVLERSVRTVG